MDIKKFSEASRIAEPLTSFLYDAEILPEIIIHAMEISPQFESPHASFPIMIEIEEQFKVYPIIL
jgi:hypothetical protein